MSFTDGSVQTRIEYTVRDAKHDQEKPYRMMYDTDGAIPSTNITTKPHSVTIQNFRSLQNPRNLEEYGFAVEKIGVGITEAVFDKPELIEEVYYALVEKTLVARFPSAKQIRVFSYNLRKRHVDFPALADDIELDYSQPAPLAHIDYSTESAVSNATAIFSTTSDQAQRILAVNLWKSITPGNDWPLALCDARTVDRTLDTLGVDIVYPDRFTENEYIYYNPGHQWYYLKDMEADEMILFIQKDSAQVGGGGVPHASFSNPEADEEAPPRMSLEMRAYIMY